MEPSLEWGNCEDDDSDGDALGGKTCRACGCMNGGEAVGRCRGLDEAPSWGWEKASGSPNTAISSR